jgi:two-component system, sensor histidine kinase and response regulator
LLTSEDQPESLTRRHDLGIAAVARKPVQQEELLDTMHLVLCGTESPSPAAQRRAGADKDEVPASPQGRPLRILVAEDNELNQQVVRHLLGRAGHHVEIAGNGRVALDTLERGAFDLLLLDVHMPELDGFEVIQALRQREQGTGQRLPVIAVTARSMKGDRERCLAAGMDEFVSKPIRRPELFATIDRLLGGSAKHDVNCNGKAAPSTDGLLDSATLLAACDADPALLQQMIDIFQADSPAHLARIEAAVRDSDARALRETAHKLRGLVAAFSSKTAELAELLENSGRDGHIEAAAANIATLAAHIHELGERLRGLSLADLQAHITPQPA